MSCGTCDSSVACTQASVIARLPPRAPSNLSSCSSSSSCHRPAGLGPSPGAPPAYNRLRAANHMRFSHTARKCRRTPLDPCRPMKGVSDRRLNQCPPRASVSGGSSASIDTRQQALHLRLVAAARQEVHLPPRRHQTADPRGLVRLQRNLTSCDPSGNRVPGPSAGLNLPQYHYDWRQGLL